MGDPLTSTLGVVGLGLQVLGGLIQGRAEQKSLSEQARIAEANARLAEAEGVELMRRGAVSEYQLRGQGAQVLAGQRTAYGSSGVVAGAGSAASVEFGSRLALEMDAAALRFAAENQRHEKRVEAWNLRRGAAAVRSAAKSAMVAGILGAGSTLLTGMSQVSGKWSFKKSSTGGGGGGGHALAVPW